MYTQLLKCSYTLYVVPYSTENYKQWLPNGISWLFIDLLPFWPNDARFPALYDVTVSWLRLKTLIDCIPHSYWMYTKSFSTLRCCGWAYGCIIIAVIRAQVGVYSGKCGMAEPFEPVWCCGVIVEASNPHWLHPTSILNVYKCFSSLRWRGWAYGCILMPYYMCRWRWVGFFGEMGYGRACMMLRCHGWGFKPPLTASHIHIGCIQRVLACWDAVDGHMGASLCCNMCSGGGEF